MKPNKLKRFLIIFIILQTTYSLCTAQQVSALWPLSSNNIGLVTNNNITAANVKVVGLVNPFYSENGISIPVPSSIVYDPTKYIQFEVAPAPGHKLIVENISSTFYRYGLYAMLSIQYSLSPLFTNNQLIATYYPNPTPTYRNFSKNITISEGEQLYIRLYPYNAGTELDRCYIKDFKISGYITSPTSITYNKETWCTNEVTAEANLTGTSGGLYSSTAGLVINSTTGSIDLANSQPGTYNISYSISGEVVATTDIFIFQPSDCFITGTDGPVYPLSIHTFSAPEGMSFYSWSVSGNASITGSQNEPTVTVTAGASGGASFNLSLTIEDGNNCTSTCSKAISVDEIPQGAFPTATLTGSQTVCSGNNADLVVSLTGQAPWSFTWTDGVNNFPVLETIDPQYRITVNPTKNTTYSLSGQVIDGTGNSGIVTGEATVLTGPVTLAPEIYACPNTSIEVPVTVKSFRNVRDISLTLKYDPSVMTYQGFINGGIAFDAGEIEDNAYGDFRLIRISKFSGVNLPALADNAELLRLKFNYAGGNTALDWVDSPDDAWCSYSYLSALNATGFETEPFCDMPTAAYYINGSVKQLSVTGTDISPIPDVSTITGTPVIIPVSVTYPDLAAQEVNATVVTDARITYNDTGTFPAGARVFKVTYNGISVLSSPYNIGEKDQVLLSEILGTEATSVLNHSNQNVSWEFYIDGIASPVDVPVKIEALAYTNLNECVIVLDAESFNATFAHSALAVTESVDVCGAESLQFTAQIEYPNISNLNTAVKADARIIAANAFPEGTVINWNYNSSTSGSYTLPGSTNVILLSTIVGAGPSPLQGHSGIDIWAFEISNAGLMTNNEVSIEAIALLDGENYLHSSDKVIITVNALPEVTEVSLLTSTDESTWTDVSGDLSFGYVMCADPAEDFHYLDIDELTGSAELNSDFEKNAFYLDENSVPAGFFDYWNTQGVNAAATEGWQAVMWQIINGEEPMFYIRYDGTGYSLIDGLQYQYSNVTGNLRISGDYPAGTYSFIGSVTDVNGCASEEFAVTLNLGSAPVITCPSDIVANNDAGECGAVVSFAVTATGSPAPVIVYTLSDGTPVTSGHFFPIGITPVLVTATAGNDCKTATCTFNVTVTDNEAPKITCPVNGNTDVILSSAGTYNHIGTGWDASASDNCAVKVLYYTLSGATTGTGASLDATVFNLGTTTVTWKAADGNDNSVECSFTVTVFGVGLNGTVKYYNKVGTLLDNITISLLEQGTGSVVATTTTNFDGKYSFANLSPGIYNVNIGTTRPMRSINSTDAGQVNAWNVAQSGNIWPSIEKVRFLAGNVNEDDYVNSADAGMIQNYFLTLGTEVIFDKSWEFWKANDFISAQPQSDNVLQIEIPAVSSALIQDFYGLVSGDFNRSNIPESGNANSLTFKSARSDEGSVTLLKGDTLTAGTDDLVEIPIRAVSSMQVGAISLILDFPTEQFQVVDVFLKDNPNQAAGFNVMDNMLIIGWNSVDALLVEADEPIVTLRLKTIGDDRGLPVFFELVSNPLNELADENMIGIDNALLIMDGIMVKETITGTEAVDGSALKLTCYPNPFGGNATIRYILPGEGRVYLDVTGLPGNRISILSNKMQSAGEYLIDFNGANLVPGVYHVTLRFTGQNGRPKVATATLIKQ